MATLKNGAILHDRYEILELIGRGGFGAVYRAKDQSLGRICAVKENLNDTEAASRQFHREASLLAGLNHPSLPRVTDHFRIDGQGQYLVMDFIEGKSLQQLLAANKGPLDEDEVGKWMIQVTQALHYLHNRQPPIVHRDIKPANIIVTNHGRAILVDFGISKVVEGGGQTTMGARAITPGFSPPEQYGVSSTDNRSDLYSLGATMYACITGKNPPESIQMMMGQATLPEPQALNDTISRSLSEVIRHSMILAMGSRYQSAAEMEGALIQATTEPIADGPPNIDTKIDPVQPDEFPPTIDPPNLPEKPISAPSQPEATPASKPTPSKKLKKKNSLPIWAWAIIAVGALLIVCFGSLLLIGIFFPPDETPTPNSEPENGEANAVANPSQPIEVDGLIINWRVGGNAFIQTDENAHVQRFSHFALDHQSGKVYSMSTDQLVIFDRFGQRLDAADYSAAFSTQDMTIGPDGNLYVLDKIAEENFVRVFSPDLRFLREFGQRGTGADGVSTAPVNLTFGPDGYLWMIDYRLSESQERDVMVKFDPNSGEIYDSFELNLNYSSSDQLVNGANGKLYLLIGRDALVYEINEQFESVHEIDIPNTNFADSLGVAADGTLFVGVSQDEVFIQFDQNGELIKQFGTRSEESDIAYPAGIFYNIEKIEIFDNNLFVLDESVTYSYIVSIFP